MVNTFIGNLGHLFVVLTFVSSIVAAFSYFKATQHIGPAESEWKKNGRFAFFLHVFSVFGIIFCLYFIISNHLFEYHYAWSHSSLKLPREYLISCFWEGQEGSFLLWLFWHAVLGLILIFTNRYWEAPVMTVFALVQAFLASMILGIVIPWINLKLGSSPFILLRDAMDAPIFKEQPDFVPEDGTGLNPLLQNYWMVIHPPTLFLGFAASLVPFAYAMAGLWKKKYKDWIRPALPWMIFGTAILGLGILMGGYWAYETLNFGGYWNWDPVENAVYVPWLIMVAAIHTMITYKNSGSALKTSIILVIASFILILYSTFLTRSGILGDASVHSFTDLGLSGQLLIYLMFFTIGGITLAAARWSAIPTTSKEISTYSREFWIFIGATTLCLGGFQVLVPTSYPVINSIAGLFGAELSLATPADQIGFYSKFQLWFGVGVALLSGTGQYFWWKKMDRKSLVKELTTPFILTLLITTIILASGTITKFSYIALFTAGLYTIIANGLILIKMLRKNPKLSGGAIAHIGIGMILIGILFSSGYNKVVSLNRSGILISADQPTEFNNENLLLFINQPKEMAEYQLQYKGEFVEPRFKKGFVNKNDILKTRDPYTVIAKKDVVFEDRVIFKERDTFEIFPENTYYKIAYTNAKGKTFSLYPRAQVNPQMGGLLASPDINRRWDRDLYTHVSSIRSPEEPHEWSEIKEFPIGLKERFFLNDYIAVVDSIIRVPVVDGVALNENDVAVKARIKIYGEDQEYIAEPIFIIKDGKVARLPDEINNLGLRVYLLHIDPNTETFTIGANTRQKDWVVLKAMEKPLINVLWIGTLVLMAGFTLAIYRRYDEFVKMRNKNQE